MAHNQFDLYKKIQLFLKTLKGKNSTNTFASRVGDLEYSIDEGICSGLTALWLSSYANNKKEFLDDLCQRVLNYKYTVGVDIDKEVELDIEAIINAILISQHDMYYLENAKQADFSNSVAMINVSDKLAILREQTHLINSYTAAELEVILDSLPQNALLRIANYSHTIGLIKNEQGFVFFDSNNDLNGENIADTQHVVDKIFTAFKGVSANISLNITCYNVEAELTQYAFPENIISKKIAHDAELLLLAIAAGDEPLVEQIINKYPDLLNTDPVPLNVAQSLYQYKIMQLLIKHGAKLDIRLPKSSSTLLIASILQNKKGYHNGVPVDLGYVTLNMLLANGADPNFVNEKNITPVDMAIYRDKPTKLALLLAYGAILNENNIQEIQDKFSNTAKTWRLIQDIKGIQKTLNKNINIDERLYRHANYTLNLSTSTDQVKDTIEFLECINELRKHKLKIRDIRVIIDGHTYTGARAIGKINNMIATWAHDRQINLAQAWHLYELSRPLTSWWRCGYTAFLYANFREVLQSLDTHISTIDDNSFKTNLALAISLIAILEALQHFTKVRAMSIPTHKFKHLAITTQNKVLNHLMQLFGLNSGSEVVQRLQNLAVKKPITFLANPVLDTISMTEAAKIILPVPRYNI